VSEPQVGHLRHAAPAGAAPSGRANPGRLGVLWEIAARLSESPEGAETLQAVVDGARRATAADGTQLLLQDVGGAGPAAYASGDAIPGGVRHEVPVRAGGHDVGLLTLMRAQGRGSFAEADTLFADTLAGHVASALDAARLRRAEHEAGPERRRFAQALSHELRSPLATLRGFLDVIGRGPLTEDQRTFVDFAERNTRHLQELADELVTLTRLESESPTGAEPADVGAIARDRLGAHGLRGTVAVEEGLATAVASRRLELALDALLANVRTYAPEHSAVAISAYAEGGMLLLSVDDAGPGVMEDERERIFDRFVRGSAAARSGVAGHGLGLAVVSAVARAAGGRAWCEPAPGGGARFALSLPVASWNDDRPAASDGPDEGREARR
jgi:signal transduction histidine kinase